MKKKTNKYFILPLVIPLLILLSIFVAMQFNNEIQWKISDFVIAAILLLSATSLICLISLKTKKLSTKAILVCLVIGLLLLIWLELAVGIFNSPFAGS